MMTPLLKCTFTSLIVTHNSHYKLALWKIVVLSSFSKISRRFGVDLIRAWFGSMAVKEGMKAVKAFLMQNW